MSFGFGVNDFVAVLQLANNIRKQFVDAPSQFKAISDEVKSLSSVLRDIEDVFDAREPTSQQKTELEDIAKGCRSVLDELKETLERYKELDSDFNRKTFAGKARKAWKRLKWEPEDIKELRSRVVANITLLNAFQGQLTRDNTWKLVRHQDDQERQNIIDWLTPIDHSTQQSDFISRQQEGTGQWLLDSSEFQDWLAKGKQTLFCPGIPGAGKTILTSIAVEHLSMKFENDASIGIAHIYCNFQRQQEQTPTDMLASLLKQLVQEQHSLPDSIKSLYERHKKKQTRPSFKEISKILHSVVADYSRVFIFIDALDECPISNGVRWKFLSEIFNLQAKIGMNLFATSRFIPEIVEEFKGSISLEIRASNEDVQRYLDGHMSQLPVFVSRNPDLQEKIQTTIINAVDGMFLLAQLYVDSLSDKTTERKIIDALDNLCKGSEALDLAYEGAMERIKGQKRGFVSLAEKVLLWVTCTKRPLTTLELQHALAVEVGDSKLDEKNLPQIADMVSVCQGLVTVDEQGHVIRLVHYTTQEYLQAHMIWLNGGKDIAITDPGMKDAQQNDIAMAESQKRVAMACVAYLSFDVFENGSCSSDEEFEKRLQLNPLYDYAARNWGHHARAGSVMAEHLILGLLENEAKLAGSSQVMMTSGSYFSYHRILRSQMTGVHVTAYFGLREAIKTLLRNGHGLDPKDDNGRTPLSWAAQNGHEAVVNLLLATNGVDPDSKDNYDRTPLSYAARSGYEAVVKLLLAINGVDPDYKGKYGQTPLSYAARSGHEAVVNLLLATNGVDPDSKDNYGRTPLSYAARSGHEAVVKLLLATNGVDPDSKDNYGWTPLSYAARSGHEAVVKLLLATNGVDPKCKGKYGQTPLSYAAESGHEAVVKPLESNNDPSS